MRHTIFFSWKGPTWINVLCAFCTLTLWFIFLFADKTNGRAWSWRSLSHLQGKPVFTGAACRLMCIDFLPAGGLTRVLLWPCGWLLRLRHVWSRCWCPAFDGRPHFDATRSNNKPPSKPQPLLPPTMWHANRHIDQITAADQNRRCSVLSVFWSTALMFSFF